jgi:hypothetical protein
MTQKKGCVCRRCGDNFKSKQARDLHECRLAKISCSYCNVKFLKRDKNDHIRKCEFTRHLFATNDNLTQDLAKANKEISLYEEKIKQLNVQFSTEVGEPTLMIDKESVSFEYTEDVDNDLFCAWCEKPLEDPIAHLPCRNACCRKCVSETNACPVCKTEPNLFVAAPRQLTQLLGHFNVRCTGCNEEMIRSQFDKHKHQCESNRKHLLLKTMQIFSLNKFDYEIVDFESSHCVVQGAINSGKTALLTAIKLFELAMILCYDASTGTWKSATLRHALVAQTLGVNQILPYNNSKRNSRLQGTFVPDLTYSFEIVSLKPIIIVPLNTELPPPPDITFSMIHFQDDISGEEIYTGPTKTMLDRALKPPNLCLHSMIMAINKNTNIKRKLIETMQRFYPTVTNVCDSKFALEGLVVFTAEQNKEEWSMPFGCMSTNYKNLLLTFATIYYKLHIAQETCVFLVNNMFLGEDLQKKLYEELSNVEAQVITCSYVSREPIPGFATVCL